jgi:hypothetical protein
VQVADLHVAAFDDFARELHHDAYGAVHGRVSRADVEQHRLGRQLELGFVEILIEGFHVSCPRA